MPATTAVAVMKSVAKNSVPLIQGSGMIAFASSFIFGTALIRVIKMIGIIQVVNHIPLMSINVPSNAINFYKMVIPIVNYDLLSNFNFYEDFLIRISRTATS